MAGAPGAVAAATGPPARAPAVSAAETSSTSPPPTTRPDLLVAAYVTVPRPWLCCACVVLGVRRVGANRA